MSIAKLKCDCIVLIKGQYTYWRFTYKNAKLWAKKEDEGGAFVLFIISFMQQYAFMFLFKKYFLFEKFLN